MAWAIPCYSRSRVDQAGREYIDASANAETRELARVVINNWRSSHSYPLNTLTVNLRDVAGRFDDNATVAQRIKRLPSIRHKLERFSGMKLSRMQDIGGCRAVVSSVGAVEHIVDYYVTKSQIRHKLVRHDAYIQTPQRSGYRGEHLVYSYNSDKRSEWNGLKIELQVRSRLQHAWATAVETVGTFTQQALKSSLGEDEWLNFFALMSSALALREGTPPVPDTPEDSHELASELRDYVERLDVIQRLNMYGTTLRYVEDSMLAVKGHTFLLELDSGEQTLSIQSYRDRAIAAEEYGAIERAIETDPTKDVVLVTVESLDSLRRAYPNYFLDTRVFVDSVLRAIDE